MLTPIFPFEPVSTDTIPTSENWIGQIKWDGVRILTYYDGQAFKLYNRKKNERTHHYPELKDVSSYCKAHSVILDGEVIALGVNGKPSFHEVMRRDGIRRLERVSLVQKQVPITYMVFDVVYFNGEWINDWPLVERLNLLENILKPNESVQLVTSQSNPDIEALYEVVEQHGLEGIVIKDLSSTYVLDGKDRRWQKKKFYKDLIAVVGGVTLRNGIVNAILLGLYDENEKFWYIGHVGTGRLTHKDWRDLTHQIQPLIQDNKPFVNNPGRMKQSIWLKPELTVKVTFAEWTEGRSLRQPTIEAFVEIPAVECRF